MYSQFSLPLPEKFENPQRDSNISTTNQTSLEVSIEDILNQTNENFSISLDEQKNIKGVRDKTFRPLSESKKTQPGQTRHYRYTDMGKCAKVRPGSAEKYKTNSSLETKSKKSEAKFEGVHKSQFLEAAKSTINQRSLKLKKFTPILSGKRVKLPRFDEVESMLAINQKIPNSSIQVPQPEPSKKLDQILKEPEIPINPPIQPHIKDELKPKSLKDCVSAFFSPLRNLKNFQKVNEPEENLYANFELTPNLTKILEQNFMLSSDSDSDEVFPNQLDLPKGSVKTDNKPKNREPSFGFGGGEFHYEDIEKNEETLYYEPSTSESEKNVQTEDRTDIKNILSIVTNQEFINSLKIIGKFASFIENNLVIN